MLVRSMVSCSRGKVIVLLGLFIIVLHGLNMMLLSRLDGNQSRSQGTRYMMTGEDREQLARVMDKVTNSYIMDSSWMYMVVPKIIPATGDFSRPDDVTGGLTLCTHTTSSHLQDLLELGTRWQGPISVSVFSFKEDLEFAIFVMLYLHKCSESIASKVTFHLVFPVIPPPVKVQWNSGYPFDCHTLDLIKPKEQKVNYNISGIPYPHNLLRNKAVEYSKTAYVFVIDVDLVPSIGLYTDFTQFMQRQQKGTSDLKTKEQIAYVVPCFETSLSTFPDSKPELLEQWSRKDVRPFYHEVCPRCQKETRYNEWRDLQPLDFLDIGYTSKWAAPWEPFFIMHRDSPKYDERFKQYGFNRISQVCELNMAGYQFVVLNNAFLVHKGFKSMKTFHHGRAHEFEVNRALFRKFKEEMKNRYALTKLRLGIVVAGRCFCT